jgi:hypothetical protein
LDFQFLNKEGVVINTTFFIKEDFYISNEEIDLSILEGDDENFESLLQKRLKDFVENTRPVQEEK